ncbi:Inositol polyphosphate kinase domain containing protein [Elaphomyces granulatus]|jgi:1D-myo-inositol-tetrakisphosphate 5-kinase/inositol-polyphosphate multikinase
MQSSSRPDSSKAQKLDSDSFTVFDHAAAGHDGVRCHSSGSLIAKPCTLGEIAFYESSALHPAFRQFMPKFIGTLMLEPQQRQLSLNGTEHGEALLLAASAASSGLDTPIGLGVPRQRITEAPSRSEATQQEVPWVPSGGRKLDTSLSIMLENVTSGFSRPNVLDIKLGSRLWADDAPPAKRAKLDAVSKETTSSSLGFRIAGMKVWVGATETELRNKMSSQPDAHGLENAASTEQQDQVTEKDGYRHYNKWYGRTFNDKTVNEGLEAFLAGAKAGRVDRSKLIACRLADELRHVQSVLESEESRMYSASILIVYEGDPEALGEALENESKGKEIKVDNSEDEDSEVEAFDFQHDGSLEVVEFRVGDETVTQGDFHLEIQPENIELADMDDDDEEEEDDDEESCKVHDLRLIDFAHANWTPGQGPDENVLMGVRSLLGIMEDLGKE